MLSVTFASKYVLHYTDIGFMYDYPNKTCVKNTYDEKVLIMDKYDTNEIHIDTKKINKKGTLTILYGKVNEQELYFFMFSSMESCKIFAE